MNRKRSIAILLTFCIIFFGNHALAAPSANKGAPPQLISESAVLINAKTGQVLFDKEMHKKQFPASITKIMTTILGIEKGKLTDKIVMSDEAVFSVGRNTSHIALTPGEEITLDQALHAALLVSANDACNGIAEYVSGSVPAFAKLMTKRAKEVGALGTNFDNANGLKDDLHYTTAYDMAMITKHAIQNPTFRRIIGTVNYDMPANNKQPKPRHFTNQHSMLTDTKFKYEGIVGGKAGYTTVAKFTLVTVAERKGVELIAVVMKSPKLNDKYVDTIALLDYGFNNFRPVEISPDEVNKSEIETVDDTGQKQKLNLTMGEGIQVLLHKNVNKTDIIMKTDVPSPFGAKSQVKLKLNLPDSVTAMYRDLGSYPYQTQVVPAVAAAESVSKPKGSAAVKVLKIVLIVVGVFLLVFIALVAFLYIRKEFYRWRRRHRRRR